MCVHAFEYQYKQPTSSFTRTTIESVDSPIHYSDIYIK